MHDDAGEAVGCERAWIPLHGDVAEPLKREVRLEDLDAVALQRVANRFCRGPEVRGVEEPLPVEDLRVAEGHGRARGP